MERFHGLGRIAVAALVVSWLWASGSARAGLVDTLSHLELHGYVDNFTILRSDTFKEDYHVATSRYRTSLQISGPLLTGATFFGMPITQAEYFIELRPEYESIYDIDDRFGEGRDSDSIAVSGRTRFPKSNRGLLEAFGFDPHQFAEFWPVANALFPYNLVPGSSYNIPGRPVNTRKEAYFGLTESQNDLRFGMTDANNWDLYYPVREAYVDLFVDFYGVNWLRLGKQQIVWGKADFFRLQDIVNPVDFSQHFFIDPFDDIRVPQWSALFEHRFGSVGPLRDVAGGLVWVFDRYTALGFGNPAQPWAIGFGRTLDAFAFGNDLFTAALFPGVPSANMALYKNRAPAWNLKNSGIGTRWEWTLGNFRFQLTDWFAFQDAPAFGWDRINVFDVPGCNEVLPPPGGEGGQTVTNAFGIPTRINVKPKLIRMREAPAVAGVKEKFKHARYANFCGFGGSLSARYRKQNTLGLSVDWFEPVTGLVMRTESSWTTNALQTDTTKPDLFADANIVRWVIGVDRPTFIRPLNATRTFFLSAQAFGTHLIDINAGRFGSPSGANDNFIFTAFAQTQYMRDRLIILVFGAFGTTGKDGTTGGNVEYLISDNWSAQLGVTAFLGSRQEHDLTTFAVFTGDGRPFSESGFGIGHMQAGGAERNQMNEFWGRLRYRF